ncbi:hypothetical protein JCGZ_25664 [Jatropha curcas]|uniref:Uncharacterized protein n=1 Tax=Jatropha curcas TaxID=180498 RepID=A0A067JNJ0_JATCU|nr:hypothetical protein JCGZ_25664 [Jatropha curcas]
MLSTPFGSIFHPESVFGLRFARSALQSVEPGLAVVWCHCRLLRPFQRRPLHPSYVRCSPSMKDANEVDRSPESRAREATRFSDHQLANLLRPLCMPATKWERGRRTGATAVRRRRGKEARRGGAGSGGRKNKRRRGNEVARRRRGREEKKKKRGGSRNFWAIPVRF